MSNPFSGIITSEMKTLFTNMIDSLLEATALTLPCKLVYGGTKITICPNCVYDPLSGKSSSRYKTGGLVEFNNGQICPVCSGVGKISTDTSETLYLMVIYNSLEWTKLAGKNNTAQTGESYTLTFSAISTYPNLQQAQHIEIDTSISDVVTNKYIRVGDLEIYGFGASSYVMGKWHKIGS